jgi:hypothetical protein
MAVSLEIELNQFQTFYIVINYQNPFTHHL